MNLSLDPIVKLNIMVGASVADLSSYDVGLLIAPPTTTLTTTVRAKSYASLSELAADGFADSSDTYKIAAKYFGVNPAPASLVVGVYGDGESVSEVLDAINDVVHDWYGVCWVGATDAQVGDINTYLNAAEHGMQFFARTGTVPTVTASTAIFATMHNGANKRVCAFYSGADVNEVGAVMGTAMGYSSAMGRDVWQMCYKTIAGITPAQITQGQVEALGAVGANVYVTRGWNTNVFERGYTGTNLRVDEVIAIDKMAGEIQSELLTLMVGQAKLPQIDSTTTLFMNTITETLEQFVAGGYITPGTWEGAEFGSVTVGTDLERGYALYADSFDNQSVSDRQARKGMPITAGIILSGAVESVVLNIIVQE